MGSETKRIGTFTEYQCITALIGLGCQVSVPIGEDTPYDFIIDINSRLLKVQCKHAYKTNGAYVLHGVSTHVNTSRVVRHIYTDSEVDLFCTFFEGQCYLIPIKEISTAKSLRVDMPENGQRKNISWAVNYEAEYILRKMIDPRAKPRLDMDAICDAIFPKKYKKSYKKKYIWITDGKENQRLYDLNAKIPDGFWRGRTIPQDKQIKTVCRNSSVGRAAHL